MKKFLSLVCFVLFGLFVAIAQHTIKIELKTDNYGSETSWKLKNSLTEDVIVQGGPYTNVNGGQLFTVEQEVSGDECYAFFIYDSYGDGICCSYGNGYYKVYYDNVLIGQGGQFTSVASVTGMGNGCPENEIRLLEITTDYYGAPNQNISIKGKVENRGTLNLTSFQVRYTIAPGEPSEIYTKTCNVASGQTVDFIHNIPVNFAEEGIYQLTVEALLPNGVVDNENDNILSKNLYINANSTQRKVLLEQFTTAQCPNCPAATTNITNWLNTRPNVIWVAHHAGYYTDAMTIPENTQLLVFYNAGGSTYAPAVMLDRTFLSPDGDPGPVFFPDASYTPGLIDQRRNTPAYVTVNMEGVYNPDTRQIEVTVSGELLGNVRNEYLRLTLYIIEDGVAGTQAGATGTYNHRNVMRKAISANFGDQNVITSNQNGTTYSKTFTYTHDQAWDPDKLYLVAFVNNWDAGNVNNREVLNANKIPVVSLVNVNDIPEEKISIYPNPANDILNINYVKDAQINIVNNIGQVVYQIENADTYNSIDISNFPAGTYFVKVTKNNTTLTNKLVIVR